MQLYNPYNNINLWIKHTFLSFAQGYFSIDSKFTWNSNPILTKVIIADKFAVDLGVIEKKPAIVLSRGSYGWTDTVRGQDGVNSVLSNKKIDTLMPAPSANRWGNLVLTDLIRGSVTYNVISKNGIEAEELANKLFIALSGYKQELRKYGIHKTMGLTIGDERTVKTTSEIEAMGVTVSLGFVAQRTIETAEDLNNIVVNYNFEKETTTGTTIVPIRAYENIDYTVTNNGTRVDFVSPITSGVLSLDISYYDETQGLPWTEEILVPSGLDFVQAPAFELSGAVHGYYVLTEEIIVSGIASISGLSDPEDPFIVITN
jgi:hypothetical protein